MINPEGIAQFFRDSIVKKIVPADNSAKVY